MPHYARVSTVQWIKRWVYYDILLSSIRSTLYCKIEKLLILSCWGKSGFTE